MPVKYVCRSCNPVPPPVTYDGPTIVGTPFVYWEGGFSGGNRHAYIRIEGIPAGTHTFTFYFHPTYTGDPASNDANSDQTHFAVHPAGYADNIFYDVLTRPWYGAGEVAPTGMTVYMDDPPFITSEGVLVAPGTVNAIYSTTGPPPLSYNGFM